MIELLFVVCTAWDPTQCENRALQFQDTVTPLACLMGAQPQLAQWQLSHPKWRIKSWRCQSVQFAGRDA
ncbi:MAG: hypothetical protein AAGH68_05085 [Pseudomonadota bacterium]